MVSDGTYNEGSIRVTTSIIIASKFLIDGDKNHIDATIIDGGSSSNVFEVAEGTGVVEFVGLTVTGDVKLIQGDSEMDVHDCRFIDGSDQVSFEHEGFGRVANCVFEGTSDDAIDVDSSPDDGNPFIEISDNIITNCGDDGIEIRFFKRSGAIMPYTIDSNTIINSDEDGIQLIDEEASRNDNSRIVYITNNLIVDSGDVGIGCMPEQDTIEDFGGAPGMDEPVYVINNTIVENRYGITGGDNMVVLNTIIKDNTGTGIKRVKDQGIVDYTVFHNNGTNMSDSIEGGDNYMNNDPEYDTNTYELLSDSFSIDRGTAFFSHQGTEILNLTASEFDGTAPDLGAFEFGVDSGGSGGTNEAPVVDAGPDAVIVQPVDDLFIDGSVSDDGLPGGSLSKMWSKVSGPGVVSFSPENADDTTAEFSLMGIYSLKLTGDDGELTGSDTVSVFYVKDGDGDTYSLNSDLFVEAEDFSYLYGTADVVSDSDAEGGEAVQAIEGQGTHAFADYTIITTQQGVNLTIWVRMKGPDSNGNSLTAEFHGSTLTTDSESVVGDNIYRWEQLEGTFFTEAGVWRLRIKANEDRVFWDKIAISTDPDFDPEIDPPSTSGLAGYWDMDDGSGLTAADVSGNENHAALSGTKFTSPKLGTFALRFDGNNDYGKVEDSSSLDVSSAITVAAWVNPDNLQSGKGYPFIVSKSSAFTLYSHKDRRIRFRIYKPNGSKVIAKPSATIPNAKWTHVVGTYDGAKLDVYLNGQLEATVSTPGSINVSNKPLYFGARNASKNFFDGNLDDVRIYNTALNAQEILNLFNGS